MFGKCEICSRFFFDDMDVAKKLDRAFVLTKKIIQLCPVGEFMEIVSTKAIVVKICLFAEYQSGKESFDETFSRQLIMLLVFMCFTFKST